MNILAILRVVNFTLFIMCSSSPLLAIASEVNPSLPIISIMNWHPFGWQDEDGNPRGLEAEIIQKSLYDLGLEATIEVDPVARVIRNLQSGATHFSISYADPIMLPNIKFEGMIGCSFSTLVPLKGSEIKTISDIEGKRIGLPKDGYFDKAFTPLYNFEHIEISSNEQLFQMAPRDRLDALVINNIVWDSYRLRAHQEGGFDEGYWDIFDTPIILEEFKLVLAFHPDPRFENFAKTLGDYLLQAYERGDFIPIFEKYGVKNGGVCQSDLN